MIKSWVFLLGRQSGLLHECARQSHSGETGGADSAKASVAACQVTRNRVSSERQIVRGDCQV